jgi:hypothetical protein
VNCFNWRLVAFTLTSAAILSLASCTSEKKPESSTSSGKGTSTVTMQPGEAGGVVEDTFTASAKVSAIDPASRQITLAGEDGSKATFKAGPEIRNFDQIKVGDSVIATITERLVVFVRSDGASPSVTHAAELAASPKGAKPGAMVAESYEVVATVSSIDATARTARLQFVDGQSRTVKVRSDVDLSKYKVGDSVVIRVTEVLFVLVEKR